MSVKFWPIILIGLAATSCGSSKSKSEKIVKLSPVAEEVEIEASEENANFTLMSAYVMEEGTPDKHVDHIAVRLQNSSDKTQCKVQLKSLKAYTKEGEEIDQAGMVDLKIAEGTEETAARTDHCLAAGETGYVMFESYRFFRGVDIVGKVSVALASTTEDAEVSGAKTVSYASEVDGEKGFVGINSTNLSDAEQTLASHNAWVLYYAEEDKLVSWKRIKQEAGLTVAPGEQSFAETEIPVAIRDDVTKAVYFGLSGN